MDFIPILTAIGIAVAAFGAWVAYAVSVNSRFRDLLSDLERSIKDCEYKNKTDSLSGAMAFEEVYASLRLQYARSNINTQDEFKEFYINFYQNIQAGFGEFFRSLYNVSTFIDRRRFIRHRSFYDAIRGKLPRSARLLVFYNGQVLSSPEFLQALQNMKIFKNLDYVSLLSIEHLRWYDRKFFGEIWNDDAKAVLGEGKKRLN
jgi:hypothetical protein